MKEPLHTELWRVLCDRSLWKQVRNRVVLIASAVIFGLIFEKILSVPVLKVIAL